VSVQRKEGGKSSDGSGVHDEKQRTENEALSNTAGGCIQGRESVVTYDTEGRDDKDLNQLRTEPWMPNQDERRVSRMLWSMMSKAAERSDSIGRTVLQTVAQKTTFHLLRSLIYHQFRSGRL